MSEPSAKPGLLEGVRVVDLSTEIGGAYCTKLFVDAGATVVKVEPPGGDPLRRWTASGASIPPGEDGALFQFLNASKQSVVLDLEQADDRARCPEWIAGADLVVESFPPGTMERYGMTHAELAATTPGLSLVSITPYGQSGPWANRPASDATLQAGAGITARRGTPERGPVYIAGRVGEWLAGSFAGIGALCAWLGARRTGKGQHVDVSTFEALILAGTQYQDLTCQFSGRRMEQVIHTPSNEPAKDGWVGLTTITAQQWTDFCAMIGRPEIAEQEKYRSIDSRMAEFDFISSAIHAWTREHTVDEILEIAEALRIPCSPLGRGSTVASLDHFVERGVFVESPNGTLQPRVPYLLKDNPPRPVGRAPRLGEHAPAVPENVRAKATSATEDDETLPFTGLRVVDLTAFWAGPFATTFLGALGADVIKVESTHRPDLMRFVNTLETDQIWEGGAIFHGANANKRAITLRLDTEEGRDLLHRLLEKADVLIENFSVRVLDQLGLSVDELRRRYPRLVIVRMPSWGLDGPWRDRGGFAMTVEQACGLAWRSGYPGLPMVATVCDPMGSLHAIFGMALALENRERTDEGQLVEVPLVEVGLNLAAELVIEHSAYGEELEQPGNRGREAVPQGVYPCADSESSYVALSVRTDEEWAALVEILGRPSWATDPALSTREGRWAAHDAIDRELAAFFAPQRWKDVVEKLLAAGIPAELTWNPIDSIPHPQLDHRGFYVEAEHPVVGRRRYPTVPIRFSARKIPWIRRVAPTLGQHNEEVLRGELGLSDADLETLREKKIIGDRPAWGE